MANVEFQDATIKTVSTKLVEGELVATITVVARADPGQLSVLGDLLSRQAQVAIAVSPD